MRKYLYLLQVIPKIGLSNVIFMIKYRLTLKLGWLKRKFNSGAVFSGKFYVEIESYSRKKQEVNLKTMARANNILQGKYTYYHFHEFELTQVPNWFYDPFTQKELLEDTKQKHWVDINEFDLNTGDIKNLWELSRFDWLTDLARAYVLSLDKKYLDRINLLLNDWSKNNPVNIGVNWRCGQETSIRIMKLFHTSMVLGNLKEISSTLALFAYEHLKRIEGNIGYAVAQNNNHGTSEAAALYVGACWLLHQKETNIEIEESLLLKFKRKGRKILENRIQKLVLKEGTFAQKSINYHRVVVDTMSFVLYGMKFFEEKPFDPKIIFRLEQLGEWLLQMISNGKGEVPIIGANDGAMFETLHNCNYRDYRPSLQLYYALLKNVRLWDDSDLDEVLFWRRFNISELKPNFEIELKSKIRDEEFVQLVYKDLIVRVKATQDNFRPSNDVLHLDLWFKGNNILIDSGSFSYNSPLSPYFRSIQSHNTLQSGQFEPMPRISRFLNGQWVKVKSSEIKETVDDIYWEGSYLDYRGNFHKRKIILFKEYYKVNIIDEFSSPLEGESKTIRFHVADNESFSPEIYCEDKNKNNIEPSLNTGWCSKYYMEKEEVKIIQFSSLEKEGEFFTTINLFEK